MKQKTAQRLVLLFAAVAAVGLVAGAACLDDPCAAGTATKTYCDKDPPDRVLPDADPSTL